MADPFDKIDPLELISRIEKWKDVDLRVISQEDLSRKLLETITSLYSSTTVLKNEILYRVRPIIEGEKFEKFSDIWYPPKEFVSRRGRINNVGESVLYCSFDKVSPIFECSLKPGDWYAIIQYKIKDGCSVQVTNVLNNEIPSTISKNALLNHKIVNQFIYNEFTKPVGIGTEFLYRSSQSICQNLMDVPNCDGYLYPSIASYHKGHNVALKAKSVDDNIEFVCVLICKLEDYNIETASYRFYLKHKAKLNIDGELEYLF